MIIAVIAGSRKRSSVKEYLELRKSYEKDVKGARGDEAKELNNKLVSVNKVIAEIQQADKFLINQIISNLILMYKTELGILSCACDDGIGLIVKDVCIERSLPCAEMVWYFHGKKWEASQASKCYLARSPALLEIGDLFSILADESRQGVAEDLLLRLRDLAKKNEQTADGGDRPYVVLDERGKVLEAYKRSAILLEEKEK